jgi:hemoglobin
LLQQPIQLPDKEVCELSKEATVALAFSSSITRTILAGLALATACMGLLASADGAYAQAKEKSLYERLGGVFAIAAVVDHFSDALVKNPVVGQKSKNPQLRRGTPRTWEGYPV